MYLYPFVHHALVGVPHYYFVIGHSHPLWNEHELGTDTGKSGVAVASEGQAAILGATRAAVRKLGQELGIPAAQLPLDDFSFLTKVGTLALI